MESSRDDFVIAIRSAFLKKGTQQRFSLLSLILFSIIFITLSIDEVITIRERIEVVYYKYFLNRGY